MALSEKINDDLKAAMKSGDSIKLNTIRSIRSRIIELSKRGAGSGITTEDELTILLSETKKRKEALEMYQKAGRTDLADQEQRELEIIHEYLPKQMSREEAVDIVKKIIQEVGAVSAKDFGKVMPAAMKELKGKIDGKVVQEVVKQQLGE
ncbi:MAG: GatB/YqeY domain-containing protein [Ignavibacteriales bacterium]|nr:GatB/YqeY domain-containing protein [Ignavibacteriales bacterium]